MYELLDPETKKGRLSYAILFQVISRIFTEASEYLVPNILRFDQNRVFMGPVFWKKCSSEMSLSIKSDQVLFFAGPFQPFLKAIENAFARDLGGIIPRCMGYRLGVYGL